MITWKLTDLPRRSHPHKTIYSMMKTVRMINLIEASEYAEKLRQFNQVHCPELLPDIEKIQREYRRLREKKRKTQTSLLKFVIKK